MLALLPLLQTPVSDPHTVRLGQVPGGSLESPGAWEFECFGAGPRVAPSPRVNDNGRYT